MQSHIVELKSVRLANHQLLGERADHLYGATFLLDRFANALDLSLMDKVVAALSQHKHPISLPDAGAYEFGSYIHLKAYQTSVPKLYTREYREEPAPFTNGCIVDAEFEFSYDAYFGRINAHLISVRYVREGKSFN